MRGFLMFALLLFLAGAGCTPQTAVELQNNTSSTVEATVWFSDDQDILEGLIDDAAEVSYTIPAGESRSFSRNCNEIQAVQVKGDQQLIGGLGPSETSRVYRDGTDFGCGERLHFTFTSTTLPPDLDIDFDLR